MIRTDDKVKHDSCIIEDDPVIFALFLMNNRLLQSLNFICLKHQRQNQFKKCFLAREHFNDDVKAVVVKQQVVKKMTENRYERN